MPHEKLVARYGKQRDPPNQTCRKSTHRPPYLKPHYPIHSSQAPPTNHAQRTLANTLPTHTHRPHPCPLSGLLHGIHHDRQLQAAGRCTSLLSSANCPGRTAAWAALIGTALCVLRGPMSLSSGEPCERDKLRVCACAQLHACSAPCGRASYKGSLGPGVGEGSDLSGSEIVSFSSSLCSFRPEMDLPSHVMCEPSRPRWTT